MAISNNYGLNAQKIKHLAFAFLCALGVQSAKANLPYPQGYLSVSLIEAPTPPALSMSLLPTQQAKANSDFVFYLTPYINLSAPQIIYRVTNYYQNTATAYLSGVNNGIIGVPFGVMQVANRPGDCPLGFELEGNGLACNLHFYVNPALYAVGSGSNGPVVSMLISWRWGHKKRRTASMVSFSSVLPMAQQIDALLKPVILPIQTTVTPVYQDGLSYDATTNTLSGKPTRAGIYTFMVSAANAYAKTAPRELIIHVGIDPNDRPVFKKIDTIASAMPEQNYRFNLLDLMKANPSIMSHNQIHFAIDLNHQHPDWLSIDPANGTLLQGHVPLSAAGQTQPITLIASSNTGGDSEPLTITIPIAFDPAKRPVIEPNIQLRSSAGGMIRNHFQSQIKDPANDGSLQLIIDTIEPKAPWLTVSESNSLQLIGQVPADAVGQHYDITLHANTQTGGNSDNVVIPLDIDVNKQLTPRFYLDNPQFPLLTIGQSFEHDFVFANDIHPEYNDIPYTIELAKGRNNPSWVRIEDNKLLIDSVPDNLKQTEQVFITIKNIPGGKSEVFILDLFVMN